MQLWIKRKEIAHICDVSPRKSREIFTKYQNDLNSIKLKKLDSARLPLKWFIENYAKDYGLDAQDLYKALKKDA